MTATAPVITGPYTHKNLDVFLIHGTDLADTSNYITLEKALDQKVITVHETGNVGELLIENLLPNKDIFIQSGEIVRGGKQDRTLGVDFILPAKSGRVPIPSFCVESGRWHNRAGEAMTHFGSSKHYLSSKGLKLAAKLQADQGQVWAHVNQEQAKISQSVHACVRDKRSATSLELTMDHEKVRKETEDCLGALTAVVKQKPDVLGFVFAINGKINSAESYASHEFFMKLWNKLAHAAAVEAIAESGQKRKTAKSTPVNVAKVRKFLQDSEAGKAEMRQVSERVALHIRHTPKSVLFETEDKSLGAAPVHRNYICQ
jgi:hypothetical protein